MDLCNERNDNFGTTRVQIQDWVAERNLPYFEVSSRYGGEIFIEIFDQMVMKVTIFLEIFVSNSL